MDNQEEKHTIRDEVLLKIRTGGATMKPKWHFILRAASVALGIAILSLAVLYLVSFIFFMLRQSGAWFVPIFGLRGVAALFFSMPWLLLVIAVIFLAVLEILVRHYSFAYRRPLIYSLFFITAIVFIGGFLLSRSGFHQQFPGFAARRGFQGAAPFYRHYRMSRFEDVHPGTVTALNNGGFVLSDPDNRKFIVRITGSTNFPLGSELGEGDKVVVLGRRSSTTIEAFGIRKIDENLPFAGPMLQGGRHMRFQMR